MEDMVRVEEVEPQAFLTSALDEVRHQLHDAAAFSPDGHQSRSISCGQNMFPSLRRCTWQQPARTCSSHWLSCHRQ